MFGNPPTAAYLEFLNFIADPIDTGTCDGFVGGLPKTNPVSAYRTDWVDSDGQGHQVLFHVAHLLSPDLRRRHMGNDKVSWGVCVGGCDWLVCGWHSVFSSLLDVCMCVYVVAVFAVLC